MVKLKFAANFVSKDNLFHEEKKENIICMILSVRKYVKIYHYFGKNQIICTDVYIYTDKILWFMRYILLALKSRLRPMKHW